MIDPQPKDIGRAVVVLPSAPGEPVLAARIQAINATYVLVQVDGEQGTRVLPRGQLIWDRRQKVGRLKGFMRWLKMSLKRRQAP